MTPVHPVNFHRIRLGPKRTHCRKALVTGFYCFKLLVVPFCPKRTHCRKALVTQSPTNSPPLAGSRPKRTHCRKALVTVRGFRENLPTFGASQADSLPKGIGDTVIRWVVPFGNFLSQADSLPKGIGDETHGFNVRGTDAKSQADSLPKGIGDEVPLRWMVGSVIVPSGLTAERHW